MYYSGFLHKIKNMIVIYIKTCWNHIWNQIMDIIEQVSLFANITAGIQWLQDHDLVASRKLCTLCNLPCVYNKGQ